MLSKVDIFMTGVGGQGIIKASDILADVALTAGYDVKKTDSLGMSQRGGSVVSQVRLAEKKVFSPTISPGSADYLVAFERLEAVRYAGFLRADGIAIVDSTAIPPLSVFNEGYHYPSLDEAKQSLAAITRQVYFLPAVEMATELGTPRVASVLCLGFLSVFLEIAEPTWLNAIERLLPPHLSQVNRRAFAIGVEVAREQRKKGGD